MGLRRGGDRYCAACATICEDFPARQNRPLTHEGIAIWDLVQRLGGQLRIVSDANGAIVIGLDMTTAFTMARALGISALAVPELLPPIEAVMVRKLNAEVRSGGPKGFDS